ncbi:MAG: L-threonylcarbamoyladenylate synthase [Thomasclavelia sp.]|jgi:L-threonylcarbamoyladenylate synthase|nr:L-threonylcarbamoyladenylate synthase [Thomasclavelia sp.]
MKTVLVDESELDLVANKLATEECVAFPTETVFGLGVKYGSKKALDKLYKVKNRDLSKAITLMLASKKDISKYAYVNNQALKIIDAFMPGEITLILKKKDVEDYVTSGLPTIGIRIPNYEFLLKLINKTGPLMVTSANFSGETSLDDYHDVYKTFNTLIPMIVKGKVVSHQPSTVVDVTKEKIEILREGSISKEKIMEVIG